MEKNIVFYKFFICLIFFLVINTPSQASKKNSLKNRILSLSEKTYISYTSSSDSDKWKAIHLIDAKGNVGWRSKKNSPFPHVIVFELAGDAKINLLKFNNNTEEIKYPGISSKEAKVEFSTISPDSSYINIGIFTLGRSAKIQEFEIKKTKARWVRLTITSNYGHPYYTELMEFEAWGVYDLNLFKIISNFIWILGMTLILSALSYHEFLAHMQKAKTIEVLKRDSFKKPLLLGAILIAAGISASAHQLWITAISGIAALLLIICSIKIVRIQVFEKQVDKD